MENDVEFVTLARVVKTQGRRGEVGVESHSNVPDRFVEGMRLYALADDGRRRELRVEELWPHKGLLVLKFTGIDSISDAETLLRCELQVPRSERAELEQGWTYVSDLVGCTVLDGDAEIGQIEDVQFGAGEAPLLQVKERGGSVHEIPFAESYVVKVDLPAKKLRMKLPEGLLAINAPLTEEEKRQQASGTERKRR